MLPTTTPHSLPYREYLLPTTGMIQLLLGHTQHGLRDRSLISIPG